MRITGISLLVGAVMSLIGTACPAQSEPVIFIKTDKPVQTTFEVDGVEIASDLLGTRSGREVTMEWTGGAEYSKSSLDNWNSELNPQTGGLVYIDESPFFAMVCYAFAQHRPVVLSPDEVWMVICQGFSQFVNRDPESFREYLVEHDGKDTLEVPMWPGAGWEDMIGGFSDLIDRNTKNGISDVITADFTTTGPTELVASKIVLMDAVQKYFTYAGMRLVCGIPSVTLKGTVQDWMKVREKTRKLGEFGVKPWTDRLDPILEQFVNASDGNVDLRFWQDMALRDRPEELRLHGGCGPASLFNGWFLEFFPFDKNGIRPAQVTYRTMPSEMCQTPFILNDVDVDGTVLKSTPMKLMAGIAALKQDSVTKALEPVIGWIVMKDSKSVRNHAAQTESQSGSDISPEYWGQRVLVSLETAVEGFAPVRLKGSPARATDTYTVTELPVFYNNRGDVYTKTIVHEFDAKGNETKRYGYENGNMDKESWTVTYLYASGKWIASFSSDHGPVTRMMVSERYRDTTPEEGVLVIDDEGRCARLSPRVQSSGTGLTQAYMRTMEIESLDMTPTGYQYIVTKTRNGSYEPFRSIIKQQGQGWTEHVIVVNTESDAAGNWTARDMRKTNSEGHLSTFATVSREIIY